ncbi:hypothetical protein H5410_040406 [Solanum commersonii]|uniref:Uncharacterized protein n=1 Tax=Solanum commersonii TaxID=4109 RepID=A0A9J5XRA9_SOLCO|nr:hypothetical protein H5410_040406 [Solanum commersonii]
MEIKCIHSSIYKIIDKVCSFAFSLGRKERNCKDEMIALDFMIFDESNAFLSNSNGIILKECSSLEEGDVLITN